MQLVYSSDCQYSIKLFKLVIGKKSNISSYLEI